MRRACVAEADVAAWLERLVATTEPFDPREAPTWLPLDGDCEGYGVTTQGVVFRLATRHPLKPMADGSGYYRVTTRGRKRLIHRLVCVAFHGPSPDPDSVVRHLNGDRFDNRAENLAWGSRLDNHLDTCLHAALDVLDILSKRPDLCDARLRAPVRDFIERVKEFNDELDPT